MIRALKLAFIAFLSLILWLSIIGWIKLIWRALHEFF
ncbi:hypothetical protein CPT_Silence60 [Bacillus phage Silence]|nr:hypothetical protein CPT_Silence60 [Bacillus phage Silence]